MMKKQDRLHSNGHSRIRKTEVYDPMKIASISKPITVRNEELQWLLHPRSLFVNNKEIYGELKHYSLKVRERIDTNKGIIYKESQVFARDGLPPYRNFSNPEGEMEVNLHPIEIQRLYFMNTLLIRGIITVRLIYKNNVYQKELDLLLQRSTYLKKGILSYHQCKAIEKTVDALILSGDPYVTKVVKAVHRFIEDRRYQISQKKTKPLF